MQKLTRECTEAGYPGDITIVKTDVRVPDQIEHIYDVALEKFGTFDVVVNNAGVLDGMRPVHEVTDEIYDLVYETDQKSVFLSCRRAVQILLDQNKHGSIINMGSAASLRGLRGGLMYVTCKHAVLGMTRNQIFRKVVFMQVVKRIIPPMSNEIITLVKDTSLARVISVYEIIWAGEKFMKLDGLLWPLFYTGVFYLIFCGILTVLFNRLEKKLDYYKG